ICCRRSPLHWARKALARQLVARRKFSFAGARKQGATMRSMRRSFCVLFFLLLIHSAGVSVAQVGNTPPPASAKRITAVVSAMTVEIETIGQKLTDKKEMTIQGVRFTTGSLTDRRVVVAHSGMGKVNAATAAALLVEQFQPTHVLFTGIAGGLNPDLRAG